jgi:hypothetical protein
LSARLDVLEDMDSATLAVAKPKTKRKRRTAAEMEASKE